MLPTIVPLGIALVLGLTSATQLEAGKWPLMRRESRHGSMASDQKTAPLKKHHHQRRPKALFCYALVRSPPEPTAALLAKQLNAACDGWAFFSDAEDLARNTRKVFTKHDEKLGWAHQMREIVTKGVWKHLLDSGALDEYEWFLKVDPDSFVRPSTLRKTFKALHGSSYSVSNHFFDGYFVALQADVVLAIKSLGWPRSCDIVLSGHSSDGTLNSDPGQCGKSSKLFKDFHLGSLRDPQGNSLVAMDQDKLEDLEPSQKSLLGPQECEDIASVLLKHASRNIKGPLCTCTPVGEHGPACVSEDFVTVHHVKEARDYQALVEAFP